MERTHAVKTRHSNLIISISLFLVICLVAFIILFILESEVRDIQLSELIKSEERVIKLASDYLVNEIDMMAADLGYISQTFKARYNQGNIEGIKADWIEFSDQYRHFDQIRFIDIDGNEIIRVNKGDNGSYSVSSDLLQNKKDRYYFIYTMGLEEGGIYVSPLDLNIENNEVEIPYKPMIRISTPIYDSNGILIGMIILNYEAADMIKGFKDIATNSQGSLELLNAKGYRLSSSESENEWTFMFDDRYDKTFGLEFPEEWNAISLKDTRIMTYNGLFSSHSLDLENAIRVFGDNNSRQIIFDDIKWYIVSIIPNSGVHKSLLINGTLNKLGDMLKENLPYLIIVLFIAGIAAFFYYQNRNAYSRIKIYSEIDSLTQVYNRKTGLDKIAQLAPLDDRRNFNISLCYIDIDGLKEINDTLGHNIGDELIVTIVNVIKKEIRTNDFITRLGGDEFLVVLSGIDQTVAESVWRRIQNHLDIINGTNELPYVLSASHGIVSYNNKSRLDILELLKVADTKMYEEKRNKKMNI